MKRRIPVTIVLAGALAAFGGELSAWAEPPAPRRCGQSNPWGEPKECPSATALPGPTGPRRVAEPLDLTFRAAQSPERLHSPKLALGGAVLGSVGLASLLWGVAIVTVQDHDAFGSALRPIVGGPFIAHGLGCLGAGIAMMVVGLKKVPNDQAPPRVVVPAISAGPGSMALRWSF